MEAKRCDLCAFYDMENEYCGTYNEEHRPNDKGCKSWVRYDDPWILNNEITENK